MRRLPLRVRLVAGFSVAMLVVLAGAGAFLYWRIEYALDHALDVQLRAATDTLTPLLSPGGDLADAEAADTSGLSWRVVDPTGTVLVRGPGADDTVLAGPDTLHRAPATVDVGGLLPSSAETYRVRVTALPEDYLVVAVSRSGRDEALRELLAQLAVTGLVALVLTAVVGERLAALALRPVERYRARAEEIAGGASGLRLEVPPDRDDEITRLGHTFNDMLAELERALVRERRFVAEASHELRTPLALLRGRVQLAQRRARTVSEHEDVLAELGVDVTRLVDLAEQLLTLEAAGAVAGHCDAAEAAARVAASRPGIERPAGSAAVEVGMTATALERVLGNLLDNAERHGEAPVELGVERVGDAVRLVVADAGPGMDPELLAVATQRFTRAAEARGRPGAGLGLALVEELVVAAGGELRICARGVHRSVGAPVVAPCVHDQRMTVTVLLPVFTSASSGSA